MNRKQTILWRVVVLGLFVSMAQMGIYALDRRGEIDTDRMLDVSVSIRTMSHVTVDRFGDSVWEVSNGSGFLVSLRACEVWTNQHVIEGAALIEIFPRGWNRAEGIVATLVNATPRSDIAILKLEHCDGLAQAKLGNSDLVQQGDESFAVGNPLGRNPDSISRGIISHTRRYRDSDTPYLQTDAAINPGNSGGALFDREGRVIGINTAIDTTRFGTNVGIGFAVPINLAMQVVAELREGPPSWGDAGFKGIVASLSPDEAVVFDVPGAGGALVVTRTPDEGPSEGILRAHDVIYRINDSAIDDTEQAVRMAGQHDVGDTLTLDLIREGRHEKVDIVLGEGWKAGEMPEPDSYDGYLGMTLEMWDQADGDRGQFKQPVITKVHSLGPAHKARVSSSQKTVTMNGPFVIPYLIDVKTVTGVAYEGQFHPVSSVDEVEKFATRAYRDGRPLLLEIELWARSDPRNHNSELEHESTAFFKLEPQRAIADVFDPEIRKILGRGVSRPPFGFTQRQAGYIS